jgi:hypothetical protein
MRHWDCRVIRRRDRTYVINKATPLQSAPGLGLGRHGKFSTKSDEPRRFGWVNRQISAS